MTFTEFKAFVCAALQRSQASLIVNGVDLLARAVNMARKNIERRIDFEMAKGEAQLTLTLGEKASLDDAVDPADTDESVSIKTVLRVQLASNGTPIGYLSRDAHQRRLDRQLSSATMTEINAGLTATVGSLNLVRFGNYVYLSPADASAYNVSSTTVDVLMDVVKWMPDYVDDDDEDFLLTHCADFLMLETFQYLQMFVKEDARLNVSKDKWASAWNAMLTWNANLIVGDSDDANLD